MSISINGNGITSANIADGAITNADIADDAITDAKLASGGGKVLQVVQGTYSTNVVNSTSTFADTGLTATITPIATTSKILVMVVHPNSRVYTDANSGIEIKIMRDATEVSSTGPYSLFTGTTTETRATVPLTYEDSPSSTSALVYKTTFANSYSGASVAVQVNSATSTIILMEIGV